MMIVKRDKVDIIIAYRYLLHDSVLIRDCHSEEVTVLIRLLGYILLVQKIYFKKTNKKLLFIL